MMLDARGETTPVHGKLLTGILLKMGGYVPNANECGNVA
jgi:hypothetical protein